MMLKELLEKYGNIEMNKEIVDEIHKIANYPFDWLRKWGKYYSISENGKVYRITYEDDAADWELLELGNFFQTKEQAEFEVERRKVETELLRLGGTRNYNDIFKKQDICYRIFYALDTDELRMYTIYDKVSDLCMSEMYFEDREILQRIVDEIGEDRIKKYLFHVEDIKDKKR